MTVRAAVRTTAAAFAMAATMAATMAGTMALVPATASAATSLRVVLKGAPFKAFTEEDTRQFIDAARAAAESTDLDDEMRWANEASGAWGTMAVTRRYKRNGQPCREIRGENTAGGRTDPFRIVLCRTKDDWKVTSSGPARN